ncbi:MAG: hypothetical protein AAGD07_02130 [Planctomycetota bacterium]
MIQLSVRKDVAGRIPVVPFVRFLAIPLVCSAVAALPLFRSSVHWTLHPGLHTTIVAFIDLLVRTTTVAMLLIVLTESPRFARTFPLGHWIAGIATALMVWLVPLVTQSLGKFALIRPDCWETLRWRLADDWSAWMTHQHATEALKWSIIFLILFVVDYFGCDRSDRRSRYAIRNLMVWTVVVAIVFRALIMLGWQPSEVQMGEFAGVGVLLGGIVATRAVLLPPRRLRTFLIGIGVIGASSLGLIYPVVTNGLTIVPLLDAIIQTVAFLQRQLFIACLGCVTAEAFRRATSSQT